ncbi:MAG: hypothetical protein NDJ92_14165 [Thermoanaerobaculia bacterium]|nr:hypothetical protein [Thermoanaerobaculia bacterium]
MRNIIAVLLLSTVALSASAKNMYIPVAGRAAGANNTLFRTDVRIFNPSSTDDISVSIHYLPQGIEGTNIPGRLVTVPKRQMVVLNDIVGNFFGETQDTIGALRLDSDTDASYEFVADSRIYTDSPNPAVAGTYGQYVPAMELDDAKLKTVVLHLKSPFNVGIPGSGGSYRSNVGVMNPGSETATVTSRLYGADGTPLGTGAVQMIPPKSMRQLSLAALFGGVFFPDGFVTFESTQPVYTYGSVIDNNSGDQVFIRGIEDKAERKPLGAEASGE